jgi:universal stress protein E
MSVVKWKSIVVAVRDPGARKQLAVRKAGSIAARTGARITLFHAFSAPRPLSLPMPADPAAILRMETSRRRTALDAVAKRLRARGIDVQTEVVWDFPPAHAIVRHVLERKPDLVIAESHRHTRLARWFLAVSDWDLIRECPCPVWFVKHERLPAKPRILTALDPGHPQAATSRLDDRLLATSVALAASLTGSVTLVHAEDPARLETPADRARTDAALMRLAQRHRLREATRVVRPGSAAKTIVDVARSLEADVLVMGVLSQSVPGVTHVGHTAEAVLDDVACDVLVVKPSGFRTAVTRKRPRLAATARAGQSHQR